MKKRKTITVRVCDFCDGEFDGVCSICGRDICRACSRFICKKESEPISGGPAVTMWDNYSPYPWRLIEESRICKDCSDKFKMSMGILAVGDKNEKPS